MIIDGVWAKTTRVDGDVTAWLSLVGHSADVAACATALLELPSWNRRLARLCGRERVPDGWVQRLGALAALHDIGKAYSGFQARCRPLGGRETGHVGPSTQMLRELALGRGPAASVLGDWRPRDWGMGALRLWHASVCHHGGMHATERITDVWKPRGDHAPVDALAELVDAVRSWFPEAFDEQVEELPEPGTQGIDESLTHWFSGLVMLADWLGSDTNFFPYEDTDRAMDRDRFSASLVQARTLLAVVGLDPEPARQRAREQGPFGFGSIRPDPNWTPRGIQKTVLDVSLPEGPSTALIEAETGSGKTEAALLWFGRLFEAGLIDGIYLALPQRAASVQIFERLRAMLSRWVGPEVLVPVLAVPGYLRVGDHEGRWQGRFDVLWPDDPSDHVRNAAWAVENAKRYFVAPAAAGTIDQVLLAGMQVRHAHLRGAALHRSLLVVDEVHASDVYMATLLGTVLANHRRCGGSALLMSATLGSDATIDLLGAPAIDLERASSLAYPRMGLRRGEEPPDWYDVDDETREKVVSLQVEPLAGSPLAVSALAVDAARRGARVLILRNSVRDCVETLEACEREGGADLLMAPNGTPCPHHGRFAPEDRKALDREVERVLGKHRKGTAGCIVVATQTVEQSLDIDADLLLTDLCPVDVLLQRIGRLHRHARPPTERAPHVRTARCVVFRPDTRDLGEVIEPGRDGTLRGPHGLGTVYAHVLALEATLRLVEDEPEWRIPADNRRLVEAATHPDALQAIRESSSRLAALDRTRRGSDSGDRAAALVRSLDWEKSWWSLDPPTARLPTRLGGTTFNARLGSPWASPLGRTVTALKVPDWLVRAQDASSVTRVSAQLAEQPVEARDEGASLHLTINDVALVYDRLGLRREEGE